MKNIVSIICGMWAFLSPLSAQTDTMRRPVSLAQYCADVVAYSHELKIAREGSVAAAENLGKARTGYLPSLRATADFSVLFRQNRADDGGTLRWIKPYTYSLLPSVVQTVYGGGSVRYGVRLARTQLDIALCDEAFSLIEVVYAAEYAYWNLAATQMQLESVRRYIDIILSSKEVVTARFDDGYISKTDVLMIEARLNEAEYGLVSAEQNYRIALHNFNILRGDNPDLEIAAVDTTVSRALMPERIPLERILDRRPDYEAARLKVEADDYAVAVARSGYNPQLSAEVSGVLQNKTPNLTGAARLDGYASMSLSVPIFHWGERRRAVASARAAQRSSEYAVLQLYDRILGEEYDAWTQIVESSMQVNSSLRSLEIARENLDLNVFSYNEGKAAIIDVLSAQLSWIQLYTNAIAAQFNHRVAIARYRMVTAEARQ